MTRAATPPAAPRQRARALHPPSSSRAPAAPARHRRRRGLWVWSAGRTCAAPFLTLTKSTSDSFVTLARSGVFLLAEHHCIKTQTQLVSLQYSAGHAGPEIQLGVKVECVGHQERDS